MSFFDHDLIPDWDGGLYGISDTPNASKDIKRELAVRRYELSWEVPFGTRKLWLKGMKTTAKIRRYLLGGDAVFNVQVKRLDERVSIPANTEHRHWVNDIEHDHHWDSCDINPKNFLYFA